MEPAAPFRTPWYRRPALWVFALGFVLRVVVLSRLADTAYFPEQTGDMKFYEDWALRIGQGHLSDGRAFYGLPGYAFLLAGIFACTGQNPAVRVFTVGVLQALVEALTALIVFRIARSALANAKLHVPHAEYAAAEGVAASQPPSPRYLETALAVLAAAAWVTFQPAQAFAAVLMPTCWLVCIFWAVVLYVSRPRPAGVVWPWLGLGVAVGVCSMMVATILFVLPLLLTRLWLTVGAGEAVWRRLGACLVATLLLVGGVFAGASPAWAHNFFYARDPVFLSAHSGLNFWMGNSPGANGYPKIPSGLRPGQEGLMKDSIAWAEKAAGHPLKRAEVSRYWSEQANRYIASYPGAWWRLMALKVQRFWNAFQYDDISVITLLRERGVLWPGLRWGLVAALGLTGLVLAGWRGGPARWVAAAVLLHAAAILPVFVTERYRLAAVPGLIILGTYALWCLRGWLAQKRWGLVAATLTLSLAATLFVSQPVQDPTLWSVDPYNLGVRELAAADALLPAAAEQVLAAEGFSTDAALRAPGLLAESPVAGAKLPSDAGARAALGQAELARAEKHLTEAYRLTPRDPGVVFALGNFWFTKGAPERAEAFYERTLQLNPHFAGAMNNLGYLAVTRKQWSTALPLLVEALKHEPENPRTHYLLAVTAEASGDLSLAQRSAAKALRLAPTVKLFQELQRRLGGAP